MTTTRCTAPTRHGVVEVHTHRADRTKRPLGERCSQASLSPSQKHFEIFTPAASCTETQPSNVMLGPDGIKILDFGIAAINEAADFTARCNTRLSELMFPNNHGRTCQPHQTSSPPGLALRSRSHFGVGSPRSADVPHRPGAARPRLQFQDLTLAIEATFAKNRNTPTVLQDHRCRDRHQTRPLRPSPTSSSSRPTPHVSYPASPQHLQR